MRFNDVLDQWPRAEIRIGPRILPTYFVMGLAGVAAGASVQLSLAIIRGLSAAIALGVGALACITFVTFLLLRRAIARADRIVLLENVYVVLAVTFGGLRLAGVDPMPQLDLLSVGLSVFLVFGRVGCLL